MFLIYSLLIADVEAKVYECGMLRALGMEQYTLVELLTIQSLLFSV
jgi:ABC-type lipoprotein release transport system permease subunit